jgi:hypothetical protein
MENQTEQKKSLIPWLVSLAAAVIAIVIWGHGHAWDWSLLANGYHSFAVFGLLAFSIMWSHYASGFLERTWGIKPIGPHSKVTGYVVLAAILLHPGILSYQLWRDGIGLPPGSEYAYVGRATATAITLGIVAWLTFLSYELYRWCADKSWWKYIGYANELAMFLIILHSLRLGGDVQSGWPRYVWYFYALSLVVFLGQNYYQKAAAKDAQVIS